MAPAAHYMIGGIKTDNWGETNIAGLFAVGETASTGVHGANRLASNSLIEALVFGKRIIETTASRGTEVHHQRESQGKSTYDCYNFHCSLSQRQVSEVIPTFSLSALQQLLWDKVGIIRDQKSLIKAADTLAAWQKSLVPPTDRPSYELNNLVLTGRLVTEAALFREESRGAHFRSDFPRSLPQWQHHIVFTIQ